jgi:hypothetical protein
MDLINLFYYTITPSVIDMLSYDIELDGKDCQRHLGDQQIEGFPQGVLVENQSLVDDHA